MKFSKRTKSDNVTSETLPPEKSLIARFVWPAKGLYWQDAEMPLRLYMLGINLIRYWPISLTLALIVVVWIIGMPYPWYLVSIMLSAILYYRNLYKSCRNEYIYMEKQWQESETDRQRLQKMYEPPPYMVPTGTGKYAVDINLDADDEDQVIPPFLHLRPAAT